MKRALKKASKGSALNVKSRATRKQNIRLNERNKGLI